MATRMEQDKGVKVNWLTVNVPTIASIVGMGVLFMTWSTSLTTQLVQQDARLDQIEASRMARSKEVSDQFIAISQAIAKIPNLEYRVTMGEAAKDAANARIDRQSDAITALRDDIARVSTSIELLTQKIENAFPPKRTSLDSIPNELMTTR